jgi:hypothetical protein
MAVLVTLVFWTVMKLLELVRRDVLQSSDESSSRFPRSKLLLEERQDGFLFIASFAQGFTAKKYDNGRSLFLAFW